MRIGEIAQLTGVSARSIRHYHRLGVLAEPPRTSGGYREYSVADLVRIARIAFLSSSGVPLRDIGPLVESTPGGMAEDLAAIRSGIDSRIDELTRQRERLDVITDRAAAGLPLGLLPEPVARALDRCREDVAGDPELTALLDREHDLLDLVALSADFPAALTTSYTAIGADADRRLAYLELLAGFHRIEGRPPNAVEEQISDLVDALLADPDLRSLIAGAPSDTGGSGPEPSAGPTLHQLLPDPAQREVVRRVLDALGAQP